MALIEVVFYAANESIQVVFFRINDVGGSIVIHTFGAYFGLAVAWMCTPSDISAREADNACTPTSDLFSMIGTVFLWMYWPSFNAAIAITGATQTRAVINTYLALAACCVTAFACSRMLRGEHRFMMVDVQNATLAGGVAVGAAADLLTQPWQPMLVGMIAGALSVVGFARLQPMLYKSALALHDTCGVHNLHAMPGVLGAITSIITIACATPAVYGSDYAVLFPTTVGDVRSIQTQAAMQTAGLFTTLGIAILSGLATGALLRSDHGRLLFDDAAYWEVPATLEESARDAVKALAAAAGLEVAKKDEAAITVGVKADGASPPASPLPSSSQPALPQLPSQQPSSAEVRRRPPPPARVRQEGVELTIVTSDLRRVATNSTA